MQRLIGCIKTTAARLLRPFIINSFHKLYYSSENWQQNTFLGQRIEQSPLDLHLYQELVFRTKPHLIVQTGVAAGGSILFLATLLDIIGAESTASVIGVDIKLTENAKTISHPRAKLLEGSSTEHSIVDQIRKRLPEGNCMVILDSDHSKAHVLAELQAYSDLVSPGCYLVVEDTNINGHPVYPSFGPGPYEAVTDFLNQNHGFIEDHLWRKNLYSHHRWLKRC
jgi:cephalosporin hydroxylase